MPNPFPADESAEGAIRLPAAAIMSTEKLVEPTTVAPRTTWQAILQETTIEVFSTMVGVSLTTPEESNLAVQSHITGVIGIAGPLRAILSLRCSADSAVIIASMMLGISPDDPDSGKAASDAVGEICNIVAGYFKAKIGLGEKCKLSIPTIITGRDYKLHSGSGYTRLEFPLLLEKNPIWIALEIPG
jgi:CheY-specific phosphatase CheX